MSTLRAALPFAAPGVTPLDTLLGALGGARSGGLSGDVLAGSAGDVLGTALGSARTATSAVAGAVVRVLRHPRTVALPTLVAVASLGAGVGVSRTDAIVATAEQVGSSLLSDINVLAGESAGAFSWFSAQSSAVLSTAVVNVFGPAGLAVLWATAAQPVGDAAALLGGGAFGSTRLATTTVALGSLVGAFGDAGSATSATSVTSANSAMTSVPALSAVASAAGSASLATGSASSTATGGIAATAPAVTPAAATATGTGTVAALPALDPRLAYSSVGGSFSTVTGVAEVVAARGAPLAAGIPQATDFASIFAEQEQIDLRGGTSFADIRITHLSSGGWTVQIPSTQGSFVDPMAAAHPNDVVADVVAMGGQQTALGRAVIEAMELAGIGPSDPVMMVGFSLGGITAAQLVSDPTFPFTVTHIVTAGAPIAAFPVPASVDVLSLELRQDAVPKLDGASNPVRASWSTLEGNAPLLAGEDAAPGIAGAHNTLRYAAFAAQLVAQGNPTVSAFVASASPFFSGDAASTDYAAVR